MNIERIPCWTLQLELMSISIANRVMTLTEWASNEMKESEGRKKNSTITQLFSTDWILYETSDTKSKIDLFLHTLFLFLVCFSFVNSNHNNDDQLVAPI